MNDGARGDANPPSAADDARPPPLNEGEKRVILGRGTERPFSGRYHDLFEPGVYACRQCGTALFESASKFRSECGWPSFDDALPGAVRRRPDPDGLRTEIVCAACGGHLGHVFEGERFTPKDIRHCVNSTSLLFRSAPARDRALFAGGCFWGLEHAFRSVPGVLSVASGYTGGTLEQPTYEQVCAGGTGHAESVEITFDPARISYERLARLFFEWHDPTQRNRQGPDVGSQYRSAIFCLDRGQRQTAERLIGLLKARGLDVVTEVAPAGVFWPAEAYHQQFAARHPGRCSALARVPRFE